MTDDGTYDCFLLLVQFFNAFYDPELTTSCVDRRLKSKSRTHKVVGSL